MILQIDFETRATVDLRNAGIYPYAKHRHTAPLCMAWAFDDEEPQVWVPGQELPERVHTHVVERRGEIRAFNANFERLIWQHVMVPRFGWPAVQDDQWVDTAAEAAAMGLPRSLDQVAIVLGLSQRKDAEGYALMMRMTKPRGFDEAGAPIWWDSAKDAASRLSRLYSYCKQDVRVERAAKGAVRRLSAHERELYLLDQRINDKGVEIDLPLVRAARVIADEGIARADAVLCEITDSEVTGTTKIGQLRQWTEAITGKPVPSLNKAAIAELMESDLDPRVRTALQMRSDAGRSSIAKLDSMQIVAPDGRARGLALYHAAHTGRWGGKLIQPQNFPRGEVGNIESFITDVMAEAYDLIDLVTHPIIVVSSMLRGMMRAGPGSDLMAADFAAVECRIVNWLAAQEDVLEHFRKYDAGDGAHNPYKIMAVRMGRAETVADVLKPSDSYQAGKAAELGCFTADTLVYSTRGWIPIVSVQRTDRVWDGRQWVEHGGVICQGKRKTIRLAGVHVTPEHRIWDGALWQCAAALSASSRALRLALVSARSWWLATSVVREAGRTQSACGAPSVPAKHMQWTKAAFEKAQLRAATVAQNKQPRDPENDFLATPPLSLTKHIAAGCSIASARPSRVAKTRTRVNMKVTVVAAFMSLLSGRGARPADVRGSRTWLRCVAGMSRAWKWIVSTTIVVMSPGTYASSAKKRITATVAVLHRCSAALMRSMQKSFVYDLHNCGPHNRFTILTNQGPLTVHNCGFGMGAEKFVTAAWDVYQLRVTAEEAEAAVEIYRSTHAQVKAFWYASEAACMDAIRNPGQVQVFGGRSNLRAVVAGAYLYVILPSGRPIAYAAPRIVMAETPWSAKERQRAAERIALGIPEPGDEELVPQRRAQIEYSGVNSKTKQWCRMRTYGGHLVENIVQGVARDLLADAMLRLDALGHTPVLHSHDEVVIEVDKMDDITVDLLCAEVARQPAWALDCPIAAEGWRGERYRK
jgi:hypothetical protein